MAASIVVLPIDLKFSAAGPKKTFDIYNVHQYPVKYVIKTTAPEKFLINTTEGILAPHSAAKIEVTHVDISVVNENVRDRFRIYFSLLKDKKYQPVGYRDVTAVLVAHTEEPLQPTDAGAQSASAPAALSGGLRSRRTSRQSSSPQSQQSASESKAESSDAQGQSMAYYLVPIVVLVVALWLPTQGTVPNTPWYLELTVNSKITIGFVLGILSTLFYMRVQQADR